MITHKYKIYCKGKLVALVFITRENDRFPQYVITTILPITFIKKIDEIELIGKKHDVDTYPIEFSDDDICEAILRKANINCTEHKYVRYDE